ncbi:MAG: tetratricopeptide repeat protein, partial [Planctomycetes bacterium]|nr:tetratricopeptide repeat protein [Planctomycetota bacterium]
MRVLFAVFLLGAINLAHADVFVPGSRRPTHLRQERVRAQGERAPETFQVAVGLQQRGLHDDAARHFRDFLEQNPNHGLVAEARYRLGVCLVETGDGKAAIGALRGALTAGGSSFALRPECRYRLGNLLQAQQQHGKAREQFSALLGEVADEHYLRAPAAFAVGECQRELGDDAAAAAAFADAARAAVGDQAAFRFPSLYQLGFCLLRRLALAEAVDVFGHAEQAAGDDAARGE